MGLDDIKPIGGPSPYAGADASAPVDSTQQSGISGQVEKSASSPETEKLGLHSISQFTRASLEDPVKAEVVIHVTVEELVDLRRDITGKLTAVQREHVVEFVLRDPYLRHEIGSYLRKVLI
jgi:hypothetical protein